MANTKSKKTKTKAQKLREELQALALQRYERERRARAAPVAAPEETPEPSGRRSYWDAASPRPAIERAARRQTVRGPIVRKFYFAYGSNLNEHAMMRRCPDAIKVGALTLTSCKLVFRGVADVELTGDESDTCVGGLWRISDSDEWALDGYEGFNSRAPERGLYRKLYFVIGTSDGKAHDCLVYKMNSTGIMPPSEHYLDVIKEGYGDFGIPLDRLDRALQESWNDKNPDDLLKRRYVAKGKPKLAQLVKALEVVEPEQVLPELTPSAPETAPEPQPPVAEVAPGGDGPDAPAPQTEGGQAP